MAAPRATRPEIPGGYLTPKLLPWSWAESRLVAARNYWIATVTEAGRPHARPVWGVWHDDALFVSSGSRPRVAFGWLCDATGLDRGALYAQTATRWVFE